MIDQIGEGAKLVWAQDESGEIGKRPKADLGTFEIDGKTYCDMADECARRVAGGKRK